MGGITHTLRPSSLSVTVIILEWVWVHKGNLWVYLWEYLQVARLSGDVIELLIYHHPSVKPSLTLHPFGILGYVAGHSLTQTHGSRSPTNTDL